MCVPVCVWVCLSKAVVYSVKPISSLRFYQSTFDKTAVFSKIDQYSH